MHQYFAGYSVHLNTIRFFCKFQNSIDCDKRFTNKHFQNSTIRDYTFHMDKLSAKIWSGRYCLRSYCSCMYIWSEYIHSEIQRSMRIYSEILRTTSNNTRTHTHTNIYSQKYLITQFCFCLYVYIDKSHHAHTWKHTNVHIHTHSMKHIHIPVYHT